MANKDIKNDALNDYDLQGIAGGTLDTFDAQAQGTSGKTFNHGMVQAKYAGPHDFDITTLPSFRPISKSEAISLLRGFNGNAKISDIMGSCNPELSSFLASLNPNITVKQAIDFLVKR